jgi:hypothetical protein
VQGSGEGASGQKAGLGLQPLANDASTVFAVGWPRGKTAIGHFIGFDPESFLNNLGCRIASRRTPLYFFAPGFFCDKNSPLSRLRLVHASFPINLVWRCERLRIAPLRLSP